MLVLEYRFGIVETIREGIECCGHLVFAWATSAACFFQMGSNFLRLLQTVELFFTNRMPPVVVGPVPDDFDQSVIDEVQDYAMQNFSRHVTKDDGEAVWSDSESSLDSACDEAEETRNKRKAKTKDNRRRRYLYREAWSEYRATFRGNVWSSTAVFGETHFDELPDFGQLRSQCTKSVCGLIFRSMPVRASKDWEKFGASVAWFMIACGLANTFSSLWPLAYGALTVRIVKYTVNNEDESLTQDFNYHALQSRRHSYVGLGLLESTILRLIVACLYFECLTYIHRWFRQRTSHKQRDKRQRRRKPAPLSDLVWRAASPAVKVLQHISRLLSGTSPRLKLLYSRSYANWNEFCDHEVDVLLMFREVGLCIQAWIHFHFINGVFKMPWLLAALPDRRLSEEERRSIGSYIYGLAAEQLDT